MNRIVSASEGHFIAGFIEGEGHFGIVEANGGQSFRCVMSLRVRDDDASLVRWLRDCTGLGALRPVAAAATSKPQVEWHVGTQAHCRALADLLTRFPMRGRKRRELAIWRDAVGLWISGVPDRAVRAGRLRRELAAVRRFRPPEADETVAIPKRADALRAYLHGFIAAEGSLNVDRSKTGLVIHLRQDDRPLLEMFARAFDVGYVRDDRAYPPAKPSSRWNVARLDDVGALAAWLDPAQLRGRKAAEMDVWLRAVEERRLARVEGRRARMDELIAAFRAAREYRPGKLPATTPARRPRRDEAVRILRRWAEDEPGPLSCTRYAAARRPSWPTRNTITAWFGSWDAALAVAGVADRRPRPAPHRVGGAEARAARAEAQRERVLATLRYGVTVHGSLPTAMQFFRWRLVEAPATPSQGTVYKLFPGGWSAVLEAYKSAEASA